MLLFERVEAAIFAAQPSEQVSHRLWVTLSNVAERWRRPELLLLPLIEAIPSLQFVSETFAGDRTQLARVVGMSLVAITTRLRTFEAQSPAGAGVAS